MDDARDARSRLLQALGWLCIGAFGLIFVLVTGLVYQQFTLRQQVDHLLRDVRSGQEILARDGLQAADVRAVVVRLQRDTTAMRSTTGSMLWRAGSHTPFLQGSVRSVTSMAVVGDDTTHRVLPVLAAMALQLKSTGRTGPLDLSAITNRRAELEASLGRVQASRRRLVRDDLSDPSVRRAHREVVTRLGQLESTLSTLATVAQLGPGMTGQQGERRYLVVLQTPAESRATGGLVGGFLELRVSRGTINVVRLGTNHDLQPGLRKVSVAGGFEALWGPVGAQQQWYASNLSLDFPSAATVWAGLYRQQYGVALDGVLGVTPEAVAQLMRITGPLRLPGGETLKSGDAAGALEVGLYQRFPTSADEGPRNAYQVTVLRSLIQAVLRPRPLGSVYVDVFRGVAHDGSMRIASTHPDEQAKLQPTAIAGALPRDGRQFVAWSTNNAAGTKLDVYLQRTLRYRRGRPSGGHQTVEATAALRNDAPLRGLPPYVTIRADLPPAQRAHARPGSEKVVVATYLTPGARVLSVTVDGNVVRYGGGTEWGHPVVTVPVILQPGGGTATVVVTAEQATATGVVSVLQQPVAHPDDLSLP